jgi:hypothetical protein
MGLKNQGRSLPARLGAPAFVFLVLAAPFHAVGVPISDSEDLSGQEIVQKYLEASRTQQSVLRGGQMEVKMNAKLPRLDKQGVLLALRRISNFGKITYKALGFSGDNMIKNEVIARYLALDAQGNDVAITPANYKFKFKGQNNRDGRQVYLFQVTPRRKAVGLFRGELLLDAATAMPVRQAGRFVKTPSVFLKKVEFVQDYELQDGVAIPKHFQGTADMRLVGRAELSIDFSNFTRQMAADEELTNASNR